MGELIPPPKNPVFIGIIESIKLRKMNRIFQIREIKKYSLEEKLIIIFKKLYFLLNFHTEVTTAEYNSKRTKKIKHVVCLTYNEKAVPEINRLQFPFTNINVSYDKPFITISSNSFQYKFPLEELPNIWEKMKKVLNYNKRKKYYEN